MKSHVIKIQLLGTCAVLLLATGKVHAAGATLYADRNFGGAHSSEFTDGSYTQAQMAAKGASNDWVSSIKISSGHAISLYTSDNFGGSVRVYSTPNVKCVSPDDVYSSLKVQTGCPGGHVSANSSSGLTDFQAGYLYGDWLLFHGGNWVTLQSSGGASKYTVRYETESWVRSGPINKPTIQTITGSNVLNSTSGTSDIGTCTGTAFPQEAKYTLNGQVKWTSNDATGCAYNVGLRDAW